MISTRSNLTTKSPDLGSESLLGNCRWMSVKCLKSSVCRKVDFWRITASTDALGLWVGLTATPKRQYLTCNFDWKKMVIQPSCISKFQIFYPHFYGIVQFRCVDQCCSQDHLNRDQVITKNSIPRNLDWSLKYNPESSLPWDQDQFQAVQHSFRRHRLVMATKASKCVVLVGWSAWLRFT